MARSVFYSFHYQNDITGGMVVRNRWVTQGGQIVSGVIDHADFEQVKRQGDAAIKRWIEVVVKGCERVHNGSIINSCRQNR